MMAFERIEPFGALAEETRLGAIAAVIANVNRASDTEAYSAKDFMPGLYRAAESLVEDVVVVGVELNADELSALIDAQMFGRAPSTTVH